MSQEVGSLHYDLNINDAGVGKTLDDNDKKVSGFGDRIGQLGGAIQDGMKTAAKGLAVVGAGLTAYAKNATDFTEDLVKSSKSLSREIGTSQVEASRLTAALGRMGISEGDASTMFGILSKNIVQSTTQSEANRLATDKLNISISQTKQQIVATTAEIAAHGDKTGVLSLKLKELNNTLATQQDSLKQSADSFGKLGISTVDSAGKQKDFNTILFEVADKFKTLPDGIDKSQIAMDLFGRSGKDMIKVLNLGSAGIQDLEKQADALGLTLNANTIGKINDLVESQKKMKEQTDAIKIAVGTATAPVMTAFNTQLNTMLGALLNSHGPMKTITTDVLAFGGPISAGAAALFGFLANISSVTAGVAKMLVSMSVAVLVLGFLALMAMEVVKHLGGWHHTMQLLQPYLDTLSGWFSQLQKYGVAAFQAVVGSADDLYEAVRLLITGDFRGGIFGISEDSPIVATMLTIRDLAIQVWQGFVTLATFIGSLVMPTINLLVAVFNFLWPSIARVFESIWNQLLPALGNLFNAFIQLWNAINPAFMYILGGIAGMIGVVLLGAIWLVINVFNIIIQVISAVINIVSGLIGFIAALITFIGNLGMIAGSAVMAVYNWFTRLPGMIGGVVNSVVDWFRGMPGSIGAVISGVAGAITAPFKAAFNSVSRLWNDSLGKLNFNVPGWVPGIGGRGWTMPKMPYLAKGGIATGPTTAMIGEAGTEAILPLSQLDRYTNLFSRIEKAADNAGNGKKGDVTYQIGNVNLTTAEAVDEFFSIGNRNTQLEMLGGSPLAGTAGA